MRPQLHLAKLPAMPQDMLPLHIQAACMRCRKASVTKEASLDFLQAIVGDAPELPTPSVKRARCATCSEIQRYCGAYLILLPDDLRLPLENAPC